MQIYGLEMARWTLRHFLSENPSGLPLVLADSDLLWIENLANFLGLILINLIIYFQEIPSHPMNFAGLANFSSEKEQLYEEFNIIPQVSPKTEELPPGAETKNRYANVIPLPETRVHLTIKDNDNLSDYINANYVRVSSKIKGINDED